MIKHLFVNLAVITLVTTMKLMPPHIFTIDRAWAAEWNGNSGQEGNNFTPVPRDQTGMICNKISFALIFPCSDLVNPDNTLTQQGEHVKGCIQNDAVVLFYWAFLQPRSFQPYLRLHSSEDVEM